MLPRYHGFCKLLEHLVIHARQPGLVEVVAGGHDEVDVEPLPDPPHLHEIRLLPPPLFTIHRCQK